MCEFETEENKSSPKVTIIMPSLNVAEYITEALRSAICQSLKDIEIICVDAGSTDGTLEIIDEFAKQDRRIMLINSPVKSYGFQVNRGLEVANGSYVAILETDDYVDADMYGTLYDFAVKNNLDYVKCDYETYILEEKKKRSLSGRRISTNSLFYDSVFVPRKYIETASEDWYLWNGIYRTEFLRTNGIRFSETAGASFQDIGFLYRTTSKAKRVQYLDRSLYRYCVGRKEASSKSNKTIFFIRQEYGLILDGIGDYASLDEWRLVYNRMAKSFVRACMDCSTETLQEKSVSDICRWFQIRLVDAENMGFFSEDSLPMSLRDTYHHLINPSSGYLAYRKNRENDIKSFLGYDNPIIIFGCGVYGMEAYHYLTGLGYRISGFMDNSSKLWGTEIDGIKVKEPERISELSKETRYIVANENHSSEIAAQISASASREHIFVF